MKVVILALIFISNLYANIRVEGFDLNNEKCTYDYMVGNIGLSHERYGGVVNPFTLGVPMNSSSQGTIDYVTEEYVDWMYLFNFVYKNENGEVLQQTTIEMDIDETMTKPTRAFVYLFDKAYSPLPTSFTCYF